MGADIAGTGWILLSWIEWPIQFNFVVVNEAHLLPNVYKANEIEYCNTLSRFSIDK